MADYIARLGVFPYVLPLRPIPGSLLADRTTPGTGIYGRSVCQTARILEKA